MSNRPEQVKAGQSDEPVAPGPPAWRHGPSVALFLLVTIGLLAADLVVKQLAFDRVAGVPLRLVRDPEDGATLVQGPGPGGDWTTLPRRVEGAPSTAIPPHQPITVVPNVLSLTLTLNTGAVFGIGKNRQWLFVIVSIVAVGVIGWVFVRSRARSFWLHLCLGLILSGALGNLYDRVRFNAVRDMLKLFPEVNLPFGWRWPGNPADPGLRELYPWVFNVADAALVVGVGIMFVLMWRGDAKTERAPAKEAERSAR